MNISNKKAMYKKTWSKICMSSIVVDRLYENLLENGKRKLSWLG